MLHCSLEVAPYFSPDVFRIGLLAMRERGEIQEVDAIAMLMANTLAEPSSEKYEKVVEIMKKYPRVVEVMKKRFEQMKDNLDQLKEMI